MYILNSKRQRQRKTWKKIHKKMIQRKKTFLFFFGFRNKTIICTFYVYNIHYSNIQIHHIGGPQKNKVIFMFYFMCNYFLLICFKEINIHNVD